MLDVGTTIGRALFAACLMTAPVVADDSTTLETKAREHLAAGKALLGEGDAEGARREFYLALRHHPNSPRLLRALITATDRKDGRWPGLVHRYAAGTADGKGAIEWDKDLRKKVGRGRKHVEAIERARVRMRANPPLYDGANSAGYLAARLQQGILAAASSWAPDTWERPADLDAFLADRHAAIRELFSFAEAQLAESRSGWALRGAHAARGLLRQEVCLGQAKKLGGELRVVEALERSAASLIQRTRIARSKQTGGKTKLPAVGPEHRSFGLAHRAPDKALTRMSATGRYEVISTAGIGPLRVIARVADGIHEKLVEYYKVDPFEKAPGRIRVVAGQADMEAEGLPHFWAGGFQDGPTTVIDVLQAASSARLQRVLTHELTHRFDSAVHPGLPAWLLEGRAEWAEIAATSKFESRCVEHDDIARIDDRYEQASELKKLLEGAIDDYRDNYSVGHALWIYLMTWPLKKDIPYYSDRMPGYMKSCAKPQDAVARFEHWFCDGVGQRPNTLAQFTERFAKFWKAFTKWPQPKWMREYQRGARRGAVIPIYDAAAWPDVHDRSLSVPGATHAARAARLLMEAKQPSLAVRFFDWALWADGPSAVLLTEYEAALGAEGKAALAFGCRILRGDANTAEPVAPGNTEAVQKLLKAMRRAAKHWAGLKRDASARDLALAADRLEHCTGLAVHNTPPKPSPPQCPELSLGCAGWVSEPLWNYRTVPVPDLWHRSDEGHLILGRKAGTTPEARKKYIRDVFVRSKMRCTGRFAIRTRVHIESAFIRAAVVLGHRRQDRFARIEFEAGDAQYAIGKRETIRDNSTLTLKWTARRHRESHIGRTRVGVKLSDKKHSFDLTVLVEPGSVHIFVNHVHVFSHVAETEEPFDGHVGFAIHVGSMRVHRPVFVPLANREDAESRAGVPWPEPARLADGIDFASGARPRPLIGVPRHPLGTLLIWLPGPISLEGRKGGFHRRGHEKFLKTLASDELKDLLASSRLGLVMPESWPEKDRAEFAGTVRRSLPGIKVYLHGAATDSAVMPRVVVLDGRGVIRYTGAFHEGVPVFRILQGW